jgi:hypothetical protein
MSTDWAHGAPVAWSAYLADETLREIIRHDLAQLGEIKPAIKALPGRKLGDYRELVTRSIVHGGPARTRAAFAPLVELIPLAIEQLRGLFPAAPIEGVPFLELVSGLECCDVPFAAPMAGAPVDEWLDLLAADAALVFAHDRVGAALTCLALGRPDPMPKILKRKKTRQYKPGWQFYDLWPEFVEYLALALEKGASAEDVQPAFYSVVRAFPTLIKEHRVWWPDLLLAARVYFCRFEKRPVAEVGQALHDLVRTF